MSLWPFVPGSGVSVLSTGSKFSCAVLTGGVVKCWGGNLRGMLGTGDFSDRNTPSDVQITNGIWRGGV
jgi:alpha-tubulin suppressor-like RCC1 family protein